MRDDRESGAAGATSALEARLRELEARERHLRAVLDAEPHCVKLLGLDGELLDINAAGLRLLEAESAADLAAGRYAACIDEPYREAFRGALRAAAAGRSTTLEATATGLRGARRWYEARLVPFRDESGAVVAVLAITRDISPRKRAEDSHRELDARFHAAIDASGQLLYDWHPDDDRLDFLGDVQGILGHPAERLAGGLDAWTDLIHPEDRARFAAELEGILADGRPYDGTYRVLHGDGSWRVIHDRGHFVRLGAGSPLRMIGLLADVTGRERAAEELRHQEALLRAVLEHLPVGVWILDSAGTIVEGNEAGRRIWAGARYVGLEQFGEYKGWWVATGEPIRPGEWAAARAITRGETSLDELVEIECFDGSRKTIRNSAIPLRDRDGRVTGAIIVNQDVTERRRAEVALREREQQLRLYVEHSPAAVAMFDREMRYLIASRRWIDSYRLGSAALEGRSHYEIFPELPEHWRQVHLRCLAGAIEHGEEDFTRADGRVDRIRWEVRPWLTGEGRIGGVIIFSEDVTAERRAESEREELRRQLVQSQKMESVARLAGGVAHDFNNMLGVILGHAELALERCDPPEPLRAHLLQIREASERSAALTRQLLAFARRQHLQPRVLDLNETVEGLLKLLRRLIGEEIELVWKPGADLWPVELDPGQLDQVLANLAVNARDAIQGAGSLTIETDNVEIAESAAALPAGLAAGAYVRLSLTDTGSGMDEATLAHLFEPFFTTKEIGRGTGLGLATVQGIVEQHGGGIRVRSAPGAGTTFEILLPRSGDAPLRAAAPADGPAAGGAETVLVVEDEEAILRLCASVLERYGYRVLVAASAEAALEAAAAYGGRIDLLLTDVVLPGASGETLRQRLAPDRPGMRTLFMSGYTADVIGERGVLAPETLLLEKPFTPAALAARVREALDREP